jgi:hypothetical protein
VLALAPDRQRKAPCVSRWGPSVQPPTLPMWGPYGVWVPYPPMAPMIQQIQGVVAGPSHPLVCSQLNFGQSSSSHEKQLPQPPKVLPAHEI